MTEPTTPQLTEREVEEIEARASSATSGPWVYFGEPDDNAFWGEIRSTAEDGHFDHIADTPELDERGNDMEFIAHAREDVPALIRDWKALREENEQLKNVTIPDSIGDLVRRIDAAIRFSVPIQQQIKLRGFINELIFLNAALREQVGQTQQELADAKADEEYDCNRIKELNARAASVDAIDAFRRAGKNLTLWCTPRAVVVQITLHDEDTSPDIDRSFPTFGEAMRFALQYLQVEQEKPQ